MNRIIISKIICLLFAFGTSLFISSCDSHSDEEEAILVKNNNSDEFVITANLDSSNELSADYVSFLKGLCADVHQTVKGNSDKVFYEFDVIETKMMQSMLSYDFNYSDRQFVIVFIAKDENGDIRYKRSMKSGIGKIQNYDTTY